jgi:hypothetical protein
MPVDEGTILLDPPKHDWDEFQPFGLADVQASVEVQAEMRLCMDSGCNDTPEVNFLHPNLLAEACPGIRCDGMHFTSDYKAFGCHQSHSLWCPYFEQFLKVRLPRLLGLEAPEQKLPQSCSNSSRFFGLEASEGAVSQLSLCFSNEKKSQKKTLQASDVAMTLSS